MDQKRYETFAKLVVQAVKANRGKTPSYTLDDDEILFVLGNKHISWKYANIDSAWERGKVQVQVEAGTVAEFLTTKMQGTLKEAM